MVVSLDHVAGEIDTEDDVMLPEDYGKVRAFHVVGTTDKVEEKREHMLEEYLVVILLLLLLFMVMMISGNSGINSFSITKTIFVSMPESRQKRAAFEVHEL